MPASTASLESLSSPSPSPPPPEEHHSNHSNSGAAGLDSGSELSELTEDEQDSNNRANDDDASRSSARSRSRRDRIVPAPMWDWAYKQKKSEKKDKTDWRNKPAEEEEEEEEQAGPAKAMEEEEDDDQDKESNPDGDDSPREGRPLSDNEADDNEDDPREDDGEYVDELVPSDNHKEVNGDVSPEDEDEDELEDAPDQDVDRTPKVAASPDLTDDENDNVGEDEVDEDELPEPPEPTKDTFEADDEDEDDPEPAVDDVDDVEIPDADEPPTTEAVTPAEIIDGPVEEELDTAMDVDAPAPVLMSPVLVAASSIMAGASLLQPETPASSQPSTPSISRVSSRYPSAEPEQGPDVASEPEVEPEPERKPSSGRAPRSRKGKARTRAARRSRAAAPEVGEVDGDGDQAEGIEGETADADDIDAATPELDLDAEMQPAHRAEALDVLASIELKFALLRERLYVEKMDTLAWEEGLIADGTHPELLHLHAELSKRRDKRLELASHRRDYEVANVTKRRRLDEEGVWSWWKDARDELQTDMISETNSKRRRLERERRALERPQPSRRLPLPPVEVPPAPSLREIVKSSPFGIPEAALPLSKRYQRKREPPPPSSLVYPQINSLSPGEIAQDINLFEQHRRAAAAATFDPHRGMPGLMNSVLGGMPPGMDPYAMGMPAMDGPPGGRFAPPFDQHLQQQGLVQGFAAPPRLSHHHSAPPGVVPHLSHPQMLEREMAMGMRPPSGMPPHPSHHPQQFGPGPGPSTLMRRSISPVPLSNGAGPSSGIPTSMGGGPPPPGFPGPKPNGWTGPPTGVHMSGGKETSRMNGETEGRERERERDRMGEALSQRERVERERAREIEREREAERAYHMSHSQPRHPPPQHVHQHAHPNAQGQVVHGSHHHHHHHVRHHHHPPHQTFAGPGGTPHAPPMTGLPPSSSSGPAGPGPSLSPHSGREFEPRRPRSGAPTEVIELSASSQKQTSAASPRMSAFWKGDDALPPEPQRERERDRGRVPGPGGPPPPGPHERTVTPFTMGPSQPLQGSLPGSPHGAPGLSAHPPSMPASRRGSWSGPPEESHLVRPPSASHGPGMQAGSSSSHRPSGSRVAQPPSFHSPFGSPPYGNGRAPTSPPPSTSFAGSVRSPARGGPLGRAPIGGPPGMPLSPPPQMTHSPRPAGSPGSSKLSSRGRPPSPRLGKGLPKMEGFPMPESGNIAPIVTGASSSAGPGGLPGPGTLLPPLPSAGVSRMSNGGLGEKPPAHLAGGPAASKVVPVDGP